jgi:hypothetical protein
MAFDVYFRDDIAQGIVSIAVAMLSAAVAHGGTNLEYCRGVLDTARAQALNYGIPWRALMADLRAALLENERTDVLELVARSMSR